PSITKFSYPVLLIEDPADSPESHCRHQVGRRQTTYRGILNIPSRLPPARSMYEDERISFRRSRALIACFSDVLSQAVCKRGTSGHPVTAPAGWARLSIAATRLQPESLSDIYEKSGPWPRSAR